VTISEGELQRRLSEYFEVVAATRKLGSIYLSLGEGAEKLGMRPEAANIMKQQAERIRAVAKVLSERTEIKIRVLEVFG
jgi:hypothetical protein